MPTFQASATGSRRTNADKNCKSSLRGPRVCGVCRRSWRPKIGALVLAKSHPLFKAVTGFATKLATGFEVHGFVSPVVTVLRQTDRKGRHRVHVSQLNPHHCDDIHESNIRGHQESQDKTKTTRDIAQDKL